MYRLHRETYYLALDLYDRYMESQIDISKDVLQRIGVTCLFAAAKIEVCIQNMDVSTLCLRSVYLYPVVCSGNIPT